MIWNQKYLLARIKHGIENLADELKVGDIEYYLFLENSDPYIKYHFYNTVGKRFSTVPLEGTLLPSMEVTYFTGMFTEREAIQVLESTGRDSVW